MRLTFSLAFSFVLSFATAAPAAAEEPWATIELALGLKGSMQPDGVFKIAMPRTDVVVNRREVRVAPTLGLTSWMAFKTDGDTVVTHGDLCLREQEVNPVISRLEQGGIETTALHNHLSGEDPRVMFLHFWGRGDAKLLAETLRGAIELAGGRQAQPEPLAGTLNQREIEKVLGKTGKLNAGVLQFAFPRPFPIHMHGVTLPPAMGMATAINFQPAPAGAATTGDFVVREDELRGLLRSLRSNHIDVTAVHNHMLNDDPRMVFVHFWGEGEGVALAHALRAALDTLRTAPAAEPPAIRK